MVCLASKMAGFREREKKHFPLTDISSVVQLFSEQLDGPDEPNLSLLSIVLGCIENALTLNRSVPVTDEDTTKLQPIFPIIDLETIEALYAKFEALVKGAVDLSKYESGYATRELVKRISDVIWFSLSRSFKDRAHLQSLYSFLTGNKLDCFGVAFGVVAAAQVLGVSDIHLALSEDHAWVVFGEDGTDTAEVTWHGKGVEDKRGQSIALSVAENSWLYLSGQPVICSRVMEVAAIVAAANPSINNTMDSIEMGALQQELLWLLYDKGHLSKYPMGLGVLGDLEEISPTPGRPPPLAIFKDAIGCAVKHYNNQHVYPYTYMGGYLYRKKRYKEAIKCWADAASVIKRYNYTREDEEIYKEFLEIANDLLPSVVKTVSAEPIMSGSDINLLFNPEVFANILHFYDGICEWEEGSATPVLHVTWAKHLTFSLNKFDARARAKVEFPRGEDDEDSGEDESDEEEEDKKKDEEKDDSKVKKKNESESQDSKVDKVINNNNDVDKTDEKITDENSPTPLRSPDLPLAGQRVTARGRKGQRRRGGLATSTSTRSLTGLSTSDLPKKRSQDDLVRSEAAADLISSVEDHKESFEDSPKPNIAELAQQCSLNILNKDYLLGGGEPFSVSTTPSDESFSTAAPTTTSASITPCSGTDSSRVDVDEFLSAKSNGSAFVGLTMDSMLKAESPADMMLAIKRADEARQGPVPSPSPSPTAELLGSLEPVHVELRSAKMRGLKKAFTSTKLNASAIKLQLTAQSQVQFKHSRIFDIGESSGSSRKRLRRDL